MRRKGSHRLRQAASSADPLGASQEAGGPGDHPAQLASSVGNASGTPSSQKPNRGGREGLSSRSHGPSQEDVTSSSLFTD